MPIITCSLEGCDNTFYKSPRDIKNTKSGFVYCSYSCRTLAVTQIVKCSCCDNVFRKHISQIKRDRRSLCSKECEGRKLEINKIKSGRTSIYFKTIHLRIKIRQRKKQNKDKETLHDNYIKTALVHEGYFKCFSEIPKDFVEAKRAIISLSRQIKNSKQNE